MIKFFLVNCFLTMSAPHGGDSKIIGFGRIVHGQNECSCKRVKGLK